MSFRSFDRDMRQAMNIPRQLQHLGQSIWLDNITRDMFNNGALQQYIDDFAVTGLTSNPNIFAHAIANSSAYDQAIRQDLKRGKNGENLFFDLAFEDLARAADLFRPIYDRTNGVDGYVSLEISPRLAYDTAGILEAARAVHIRGERKNLLVKIPGTKPGLAAIEEAIFAGIPVKVTLLFSQAQYLAAAEAYMRGVERRIEAGLNPLVGSVATIFVSRWDTAVASRVPDDLKNRLGITMAHQIYKNYRGLLASPRWQRAFNAGARPQRLLWASTGTKDPLISDTLYVKALAAPFTIDTMPEATLRAFADHGQVGPIMSADGGPCEEILRRFTAAGIDFETLAGQLQKEGAEQFVNSWDNLMNVIQDKINQLGEPERSLTPARNG